MEYKRKLQERAQARRLGIVDPTWDEFYGENSLFDGGMAPFDDFFRSPDDDLDVFDVRRARGRARRGAPRLLAAAPRRSVVRPRLARRPCACGAARSPLPSPFAPRPCAQNNSMPILESLGDYQGMNFENQAWGYQGGYQPNSAYSAGQQQQGGWMAPAAGGAAPAAPAQQQQQQGGAADLFDLNAYEQQKQPGAGGY